MQCIPVLCTPNLMFSPCTVVHALCIVSLCNNTWPHHTVAEKILIDNTYIQFIQDEKWQALNQCVHLTRYTAKCPFYVNSQPE